MLLQPGIDELLELAVTGPDLEVSVVRVQRLPGAVGQTLWQMSLPKHVGLIVVAVVAQDG